MREKGDALLTTMRAPADSTPRFCQQELSALCARDVSNTFYLYITEATRVILSASVSVSVSNGFRVSSHISRARC
jgi:hypothetical protein